MKTTVTEVFYTNYSSAVNKLLSNIEGFKRTIKSYTAVALGDLITDGSDFGVSVGSHEELFPFFTDLKTYTTNILESINDHVQLKVQYDALGLSTVITDGHVFDDGNLGSDLKACLTSMAALDAELTSAFHYTNLCRMEYTAKRVSAVWTAGITGAQVKSVVTSLSAIDTFLTSGFHYTNLCKML
jgi:hypothetical protein